MSTLLPIIAVILALTSAFVNAKDAELAKDAPGRNWTPVILVALVAVLLGLVAYWRQGYGLDGWYAALGFALGAIPAGGARGAATFAVAAGAAVAGGVQWLSPEVRVAAQLGAVGGAAVGAWVWSREGRQIPALYAVVAACAIAADALGAKSMTGAFEHSGSLLATLGAAALLTRDLGSKMTTARAMAIGIGLLAVGAWVVGERYLANQDVWTLFLMGVVVALAAHWLLPERSDQTFPVIVALTLWIAVATLAFAIQRGYGMSLSLLGGVLSLAVLGNRRALLTIAPLASLVFYRLFREAHVDATRALDIGQHYAMVGLILGAALVLLPMEWLRWRSGAGAARFTLGALLWGLTLALVPVAVALMLGPKGAVGLLAGLGLGGVVELLRGGASLQALSLALGMAASATLSYGWLGDSVMMTRDEKISILLPVVAAFIVLAALIFVVSPKAKDEEATV